MSSPLSLRPHHLISPPPQRRLRKTPPTPRPNETLFRILCDSSTAGAIIGPSGKLVTQLRQETGAKIHCCVPVPGCDGRVVIVVGDKKVSRTMELVNGGNHDEVVAFKVSCAQEALLRVVARVVEVERGRVWCRMVVDRAQVGAVLGKGGRNVRRIRKESEAKVEIGPPPSAFGSDRDEMIVITGDILAMNRALHAVSSCLQECPPMENHKLHLSRPTGFNGPVGFPNEPLPNPHMEFFPHLNANISHFAGYPVPNAFSGHPVLHAYSHPVSLNTNKVASQSKMQEVVFRLLCGVDVAGSIIGWKGVVVRALQDETGASIIFASHVKDCEERVITITAMEDLESGYSPAQHAILCVFGKSLELGSRKNIVQARLLVEPPFIACLSGDDGQTVSQIKQATGANILILGGDHVPKCAVQDDVVVQISGEHDKVHNALVLVTSKLRDSLLPSGLLKGERVIHPSSADPYFNTSGTDNNVVSSGSPQESVEQLRLSPKKDDTSLLKTMDGMKRMVITENGGGFTASGGGSELGRSAIVTKTTIEIAVPHHLFASIFSEDENNLTHMRQISGAELEVYKPEDEKSEGKVIVSGTPNQAMAAQNLLQAFILARQ